MTVHPAITKLLSIGSEPLSSLVGADEAVQHVRRDPETGQFDAVSASLGGWASDLLADYDFRTCYPLAHAWQVTNTPLPPGVRLLPKMPFVCGGKYEVDNLYALNDVKGMQFRASMANQIRNLPDGAQIVLEVSPPIS
jgi:hypothetical protein